MRKASWDHAFEKFREVTPPEGSPTMIGSHRRFASFPISLEAVSVWREDFLAPMLEVRELRIRGRHEATKG